MRFREGERDAEAFGKLRCAFAVAGQGEQGGCGRELSDEFRPSVVRPFGGRAEGGEGGDEEAGGGCGKRFRGGGCEVFGFAPRDFMVFQEFHVVFDAVDWFAAALDGDFAAEAVFFGAGMVFEGAEGDRADVAKFFEGAR